MINIKMNMNFITLKKELKNSLQCEGSVSIDSAHDDKNI